MPRGDRTGPRGMGPMTGRGAGYCAGYDAPGYANLAPGTGAGMGYGRGFGGRGGGGGGFGRRNRYWATGVPGWAAYGPPAYGPAAYPPPAPQASPQVTREQETEWLKSQADMLQQELQRITTRLDELTQE